MQGETSIELLLKTMEPKLNSGQYVFCTVPDSDNVNSKEILCFFREAEGLTLILKKNVADHYQLSYSVITSWITLTVHSSLEAVGFTAAFSRALSDEGISCNVIAGFYHDHVFVPVNATEKAMKVLHALAGK